MGKKKYKSFEELNDAFHDDVFKEFVKAPIDERSRILSTYNLNYQGTYKGQYKKKTNTVVIRDKRNPFTGDILEVRLVNKPLPIPDNTKVIIKFMAFKDNGRLTPANIFAGRFVRLGENRNKTHEIDGLPVYSKAELEREQKLLKEQAQARIREVQAEREKAKQEEVKRRKLEREINRQKEQERQEVLRRKKELEELERQEKLRQKELRKERLRKKRAEEANRRRQEQILLAQKERRKNEQRVQEFSNILQKRQIKKLIHFTRIDNLNSIIINGILPVRTLKSKGIKFDNNDDARFDYRTDCTSLSIEYPNYWVLKGFRERYPDAKWAIIVLDPALLFDHKCYFAEHNAASKGISGDIYSRNSVQSLQKLFDPVVTVLKTTGTDKYVRSNLNNNYPYLPTSEQAEILVEGIIEKRYIKEIWFMDEFDAGRYRRKLINEGINIGVESALFTTSREKYRGFRR